MTDRSREHAAARRELAKRLHPDVGGDPAVFAEAMARLEEEQRAVTSGRPPQTSPTTQGLPTHGLPVAVGRGLARVVHAARGRLPRWVPGSRRYIDL